MNYCISCHKMSEVDWIGRCELCFRQYVMNVKDDLYPTGKRLYTDGGKGAISPAHTDDIKRRMIGPDGSIFRDRGRKSMTVTRG